MRQRVFCLAILAILMLSACARASTNSSTPTLAPTVAPTLAPVESLGDDVLAIYHKSGGIAGIVETLVVHQGGQLELTQRGGAAKTLQVDHAMLQPLRRMLEQKDFGALDARYQAMGADLFTYTITAREINGAVKTVTTMDSAKTPAYLGQLIAMLEQLRGSVAKNGQ